MQEQLNTSFQNLIGKLIGWFDLIITNLPNFLLAVIVFSLVYWLSRKVQRWLEIPLSKVIEDISVRSLAIKITSTVLVFVGLILALGILQLDAVLTSLLAGAGVAGLAIGLALQGTLANSFSGIALSMKDILNIGDFVETNGYSGTVQEINLGNTKLLGTDNNFVIIPNSKVLENPFKNYTLTDRMRITLNCRVGYEADLREVKKVSQEVLTKRFPQENEENVEFYYRVFGENSVDFQIRFWVEATEKISTLEAKSEAMMIIKETFDKNNFTIPASIKAVRIDSKQA